MTQYYSRKDYNYAGDSNFTVPFSYISKDDINVYVNDEAITTFTWLNDSQINVTSTLTTGDVISVRRITPIDEKIVTYHNMSMVLNDDNLNKSQDQILDAVQEIYDNNVTFEIKVNNDIDEIETVANTALTNANTAINTANSAETKANNAVSTANSADSKADNAVSTANTASNNATTAVNTANSAVNTANSASNTATAASNKVDAFGEDISAVIEAAEKIDELEEAVQTAVGAAQTAGDKATIASNKATEATNAANRAEAVIPSQTGQSGKFLKTNGTSTSWETVDALPSQTGQSGKFLTTDGTDASWATVTIPTIDTDDITISKNSSDELQAVGVIDSNNTTNAIKTWTGTKAQYDAIATKDANILYFCTDSGEIYLGSALISNKTNGKDIGDVVFSLTPKTDAGLHLLDGTLIQGGGIYQGFVDYIADIYSSIEVLYAWGVGSQAVYTKTTEPTTGVTPLYNSDGEELVGYTITQVSIGYTSITYEISGETGTYGRSRAEKADIYSKIFTNETQWQASVNTYGVCGKFVYDTVNNTVRLPKITGKIEGTTDITALGDLVEQFVRLPNFQVGYYQARIFSGSPYNSLLSGNLWGGAADLYSGGNADSHWAFFDAASANSVYSGNGTDTKIHEQAINVLCYIVIATTTKTDIEVDIDEIATDLNGKADRDLTNCTDVANIKMAHNAMPSDTYEDLTLGASGTSYTAPADGWFALHISQSSNLVNIYMYNVTTRLGNGITVYTNGWDNYISIPASKNDEVKVEWGGSFNAQQFRFIYAVGSESEV